MIKKTCNPRALQPTWTKVRENIPVAIAVLNERQRTVRATDCGPNEAHSQSFVDDKRSTGRKS